jgi:hypothetical protein
VTGAAPGTGPRRKSALRDPGAGGIFFAFNGSFRLSDLRLSPGLISARARFPAVTCKE